MELDDFISYKIALKLKSIGFNEWCDYIYCKWLSNDMEVQLLPRNEKTEQYMCVNAPTLWQVQKWLREEKKLIILIGMTCINDWFYGIYNEYGKIIKDDCIQRNSYETALSSAIEFALNLIECKN